MMIGAMSIIAMSSIMFGIVNGRKAQGSGEKTGVEAELLTIERITCKPRGADTSGVK